MPRYASFGFRRSNWKYVSCALTAPLGTLAAYVASSAMVATSVPVALFQVGAVPTVRAVWPVTAAATGAASSALGWLLARPVIVICGAHAVSSGTVVRMCTWIVAMAQGCPAAAGVVATVTALALSINGVSIDRSQSVPHTGDQGSSGESGDVTWSMLTSGQR